MKEKIIVQCSLRIGDEYWFVLGNMNGLLKKNILSGKIEFVAFFPNEKKFLFRAFSDMKLVDHKIIFIPCYANNIAVYDLVEKNFSSLIKISSGEIANKYLKSVQYDKYVYLIPYFAKSFLKYDVCQEKIFDLSDWNDLYSKHNKQNLDNLIIRDICKYDKYIYMFTSVERKVIILNMETDKFEVKELNINSNEQICSACNFENVIWIITNKNNIFKWKFLDNKIELYNTSDSVRLHMCFAYYSCATDKYIYIVNAYDSNIWIFDYIKCTSEMIEMDKYIKTKPNNNPSWYSYYDLQKVDNAGIRLFSLHYGKNIYIEGKNVKKDQNDFYLPKEYLEQSFDDGIFTENGFELSGLSGNIIEFFLKRIKGIGEYRKINLGKIIYDILNRV